MLELLDYGGGNVGSVRRCLERLELAYREVGPDRPPSGERPLVLPGVGAFGAVMGALAEGGLAVRVQDAVRSGTPFLGICVGLQILFDESEETPGVSGLGLVPGRVVRFRAPKVPQIGWNLIRREPSQPGPAEGHVYFVNSYHALPEDPSVVWYESDYAGPCCAAVRDLSGGRRVSAFQFHPEKSGPFGHELVLDWYREVS